MPNRVAAGQSLLVELAAWQLNEPAFPFTESVMQ